MKNAPDSGQVSDLSARIAAQLREAIIGGQLIVDERLPSETEMAERFGVSRATIREALKRLAAQSLIRTQRGASGGAFVNRLSYRDAYEHHVTTSTLLLSMNAVSFGVACEARFAMERACAPLCAARRTERHLASIREEIERQESAELSDVAFCASDVALHRALVDSAGNQVLSYQLAGAVEAMQPLMNMIVFTARSREKIVAFHRSIAGALESRDTAGIEAALSGLADYTGQLGQRVLAQRRMTQG